MSIDNPEINRESIRDGINILNKEDFETTIDGKQTGLYVLKNPKGMQAAITNYGGRIVSLLVPAKNDKLVDVVVGFNTIHEYQTATEPYYGAIIGRYGNRIANGKFILDGKEYSLHKNNGPNSLHGGIRGFQYVVWDAKQIGDSIVELTYLSGDMEEGFPGNLGVKVIYSITDHNELKIDYHATTDKKTVLNLSNHAFFNLNSIGSPIDDHLLMINADYYTPVDSTLIPIGKIEPVLNTPFDFHKPTVIGNGIDADDLQIKNGKGYDHNFVLNGKGLKKAAIATGNKTGIVLEVLTEEPAVQFYSGNFMQSKNIVRGGTRDDFRTAFCLETQHFPDSPNQPSFPTTVLEPGDIYETSTMYRFSTIK
ncbi:MAG: aldose epimerase family protein [Ginsengibacter sp.]